MQTDVTTGQSPAKDGSRLNTLMITLWSFPLKSCTK